MCDTQIPAKPDELDKARFDYAWKWFAFHADQRTKVFNFMLLAVSILASAIVSAIDKGLADIAFGLSFLGFLILILFWRLDNRNKILVHLGEDVLVYLEREVLFSDPKYIPNRHLILTAEEGRGSNEKTARNDFFGILWKSDQKKISSSETVFSRGWDGQHRVMFPLLTWILIVMFFLSAIYIYSNRHTVNNRSKPTAEAKLTPPANHSIGQ